jgi:general stress protein YciG
MDARDERRGAPGREHEHVRAHARERGDDDPPSARGEAPLSYEALGRLGGEARKEQLGHEGYVRLGKQAYEKLGPEFYAEIGRKGGEAVKEGRGPGFYARIGRKGGEARKRQLQGGPPREERDGGHDALSRARPAAGGEGSRAGAERATQAARHKGMRRWRDGTKERGPRGGGARSSRGPRNEHELGELGGEARERQIMDGRRGEA